MQLTVRMLVVVMGSIVASLGFAQVGSAPLPGEPEAVCEDYNVSSFVVLGRVVGHKTVVEQAIPPARNSMPPVELIHVDAVVVAVKEAFLGDFSGTVTIAPGQWQLGYGRWGPGVFDLETGQSYVFYLHFPWSDRDHLVASRVVPVSSDLIRELRHRSRMAGASISGKVSGIPILRAESAIFLGRVMELREETWPAAHIEWAKVALVKPFAGITAKETLIFAPFSSIDKNSTEFLEFNPPLEVGETYLFAASQSLGPMMASLVKRQYGPAMASREAIQGPQMVPNLILPERLASLETLRRLRRLDALDTGNAKVIAIEKFHSWRFKAHVVATALGRKYHFDNLPPGYYSLTLETEGIGVTWPGTALMRAGGCAVVNLSNAGYFRAPVADCSSGKEKVPLCEEFDDARAVFEAEIPKTILGQPGR